jgi:rod shape-determining protein MreC
MFGRERHFRVFLGLVALSVFIMVYQSRTGPLRPFSAFSSLIVRLGHLVESSGDTLGSMVDMARDREHEIQSLGSEVIDLRLKLSRMGELKQENIRLRKMLAFSITEPRRVAVASVVSKSGPRWARTVVINRGTNDGVEKDMAAITPEGLVGKVLDSGPSYSTVLLMTDPLFSASLRLEQERADAVYSGTGRTLGVLKYLSTDVPVNEGDLLVTSGLDALFPPGVSAAVVRKVRTDPDELFHYVEVEPLARLDRLEELIIIAR